MKKKYIGTFAIEISNFTLDWMLDDNGLDDDAKLHHQCVIKQSKQRMDQCCSHHTDLSPRKELKIAIKTNLKDTVRLGCGSIKKHSNTLLCSDTSAVWTLIPAVGAVRNPVAQFSHMNAEISSSTLVLVGRAPRYSAVWACKT